MGTISLCLVVVQHHLITANPSLGLRTGEHDDTAVKVPLLMPKGLTSGMTNVTNQGKVARRDGD